MAIEYEDFELSQDHSNLIKSQVGQLLANITPADCGPVLITSSQGHAAGHNERGARVTASNAKTIFACASEDRFENLVNQLLWGQPEQTAAMLHGCRNEIMAREDFQTANEITGFQVVETGMWISKNQRFQEVHCCKWRTHMERTRPNNKKLKLSLCL